MLPRVAAALAFGLPMLVAGVSPAQADGDDSPASLLARAFENRYELDVTQRLHLVLRSPSGEERSRVLEMASKRVDGRVQSLGRFTHPEWLRGTALLRVENADRSDDLFVYLPSEERVRRVTSAQRADAFLGTDLSYEDLEHRRPGDYRVRDAGRARVEGEDVFIIAATPRYRSGYHEVHFAIAASDFAILEVRYYKRGSSEPFKILRAPRAAMRTIGGHVVPTRIYITNRTRHTETEVRIDQIAVNPPLDDTLFSASALAARRPIPLGRR
ncbi:MAG: outer membrane lipoprotein-sorting protein [Proteobacteria bacterium]|nr:outer membrane lipoprotein-sorting protein [Pseudomonadota bacterium]